jgi:hypothetical protein
MQALVTSSQFKALFLLIVSIPVIGSSQIGRPHDTDAASRKSADTASLDVDDSFSFATIERKDPIRAEDTNLFLGYESPFAGSASVAPPPAAFSKGELNPPTSGLDDSLRLGPDNSGGEMEAALRSETRLARVTVYWPGEGGDHYTKRCLSSSGVRLRDGHCAVDPEIIPYGSVVKIPGMGKYVAVDTGAAVVARRAARAAGRTPDERNALVIDVYCSSRAKARAIEASADKFALITWDR